jgi:hypothetical protein
MARQKRNVQSWVSQRGRRLIAFQPNQPKTASKHQLKLDEGKIRLDEGWMEAR